MGRELKGFDDDENDDGHENDGGDFIEDAEGFFGMGRFVLGELADASSAPDMEGDKEGDEGDFAPQPGAGESSDSHDGESQQDGGGHGGSHDAAVKAGFHLAKSGASGGVVAGGVVGEQARQIQQPRHPGDNRYDVQRFQP